MGFDKNYPNRKDKRKPLRGSKAFDPSCRNHGNCPWCRNNRKHKEERATPADEKEQLKGSGREYTE